ncbi:multiprotein-bridging factor 1 family protein [Roseomonas sp. CCTCC AB2023176]|uniref:helix-turn-helix domain-containing protein n=1 Tax=Roseomonas sp. CCTCC AB2023176 TaxID=3342640 RepID=UPI0035E1F861
MTGEQCRAARHLLGWSAGQLGARALHAAATVRNLEAGRHRPQRATILALREALVEAGIEFPPEGRDGPVRLRGDAMSIAA